MSKADFAIRFLGGGGPEVLIYDAVVNAPPGPGEVRVRHNVIGVNFIDILQRRFAPPAAAPHLIGREAVGIVEALGAGVENLKLGQRVGVATAGPGAYATARNVPADKLIPIPDAISDESAAAILFKGLTAQYLLHHTHRVKAGDVVVVHAAAGGVGSILCSWASALGATVLAVAGGSERTAHAKTLGAAHVIDHRRENIAERVAELTDGRKADVVYDSVGLATYEASLDSLRRFGLLVIYGAASGATPPIDPETLNAKGGLYLTRQSIFMHNATREDSLANAQCLFEAVGRGAVKPVIGARYALQNASEAHAAVEARVVTGSALLTP